MHRVFEQVSNLWVEQVSKCRSRGHMEKGFLGFLGTISFTHVSREYCKFEVLVFPLHKKREDAQALHALRLSVSKSNTKQGAEKIPSQGQSHDLDGGVA